MIALSPEEKASLCSGQDFWQTQAIARLGIPAVFLADGPHGLRKPAGDPQQADIRGVPATCFPTASALANSWDRELLRSIGKALATECRAHGVGMLLGPGINIKRSPLCGRNFEYFSEDPLLGGELAAAWIEGLQHLGVGACLKHYAVNNQEHRRMVIDAVVDERALREIYLRGFEIAVKRARPAAVMAAYNRLNGEWCSENSWLLDKVLRAEWGFGGLVVSDWGACNDRVAGLRAGLDLEMPSSGGLNDARILGALRRGELEPEVLERSVRRVLDFVQPAAELLDKPLAFDRNVHHALAHRAAAASIVLLRNDGGILPIQKDLRVAVIGEFAATPRYQGTGSSQITPTRIDDALTTFARHGMTVRYTPGYRRLRQEPDESLVAEACREAAAADIAVVFAGLPESFESEAVDRAHMRLPAAHDALITRVVAANPHTVVVLCCSAPVEMPWLARVPAVVATYPGGQAGGSAIVDLLIGISEPCGKLAETWPLALGDVPSSAHFPGGPQTVEYRESIYVGYRYFASAGRAVAFPFGHGLGYTSFAYTALRLSHTRIRAGDLLQLSVCVSNTGTRPGTEIVQLYTGGPGQSGFRPALELRGFARVCLAAGESRIVEFELDQRAFACFDPARGDWLTEDGMHHVLIGASSEDIRLVAEIGIESPDTVATRAALRSTAPSYFLSGDGFPGRDAAEFRALLGREPPPNLPSVRLHLNSLLCELRVTRIGALLYHGTLFGSRRMARRSRDTVLEEMMVQVVAEMPLRQLVAFSGGALTFEMAEALLTIMNGRILAGTWQLLRAVARRR